MKQEAEKKMKNLYFPQVPMVFILDDELTMMMPGEEDAGGFLPGEMGRWKKVNFNVRIFSSRF